MPVVRSGKPLPSWGELEGYEVVRLEPGASRPLEWHGPRATLFVCAGACTVGGAGASAGDVLDLRPGTTARADAAPAVLVHAWGRWGDETGGAGVFTLANSPAPRNAGDPADYPRCTDFDRHYHDCDEYWIIIVGGGVAVSEGETYEVGPGDCVATGRGHHHDLPVVHAPILGVYLETTLEGAHRRGHLWEHTHGPAQPCPERR